MAMPFSEEHYRLLFESIDQGYCTIEVLFNEDGEPFDYRFLDVNRAFEQQTPVTARKRIASAPWRLGSTITW